ncbi:MAG: UDP-2,3-diacylglucosamine diphosphatase [Pseudomonadota bacterium]
MPEPAPLFVSDLHLDPGRPEFFAQFEALLARYEGRYGALYLLGDLFEFWIGDDFPNPMADATAELLSRLSSRGTPIYFMAGNRDFLLGEDYARRCGMTLLEDPTVIDLNGRPVLLTHGDELCTDDLPYQQFRAQVRQPEWITYFLSRSLEERLAMAREAREASQAHTSGASGEIMDVNQDAVEALMTRHGVAHMIHGHTHRPETHHFELNGAPAQRLVLGDWYEQSHIHVALGLELEAFGGRAA